MLRHLPPFATNACHLKFGRGFSLIELMVAVTIGMLIALGLATIFSSTSRTNREMTQMNMQIENGRAALQILSEDLNHAGFWERHKPAAATAIPDPCLDFASWPTDPANYLAIASSSSNDSPGTCDTLISNKKANSDVLVVRFADRCAAGEALVGGGNCPDVAAGEVYFQASCNAPPKVATTGFSTTKPSCAPTGSTAPASVRKFVSNIYYIRDSNPPALMRSTFSGGAQATPEVLVEGIESLVVEYGIDSTGNDGTVDKTVRCTTAPPCTAADLSNAVTATLHILSRNLQPTAGHNDTKTYTLGDVDLGPFNDRFLRHAYSTTVRLTNVSIRRNGS